MNGGDGVDTALFEDLDEGVEVRLLAKKNTANSSEGDVLISIENLIGTNSDDLLDGNGENNIQTGLKGDDILFGRVGDDELIGGQGNDRLDGGCGSDILMGGLGDDELNGGRGDDELSGGDGDDFLMGGRGADVLDGGQGIDTVSYADGEKRMKIFLTKAEANTHYAMGDTYRSIENVIGSNFDDKIKATGQNNLVKGQMGDDNIAGLGGDDTLEGGVGDDKLNGGRDDDTLNGGLGDDILKGGPGADQFVFGENFGNDTIKDFDEDDLIDLSGVAAIEDFSDLSLNHMTEIGGDTIITAGTNTIKVENTLIAELTSDHFAF